jgi:hypothetical protein
MRGEETKPMAELIGEDNKTMTMDLSIMDVFIRDWWDMTMLEILQHGRQTLGGWGGSGLCGGLCGVLCGGDAMSSDGGGLGNGAPTCGGFGRGATGKDGVA